jgi:hypothetical protein
LISKNWIEGAFFGFESQELQQRRREVSGFSARERKTARGGSLLAVASQRAKKSEDNP